MFDGVAPTNIPVNTIRWNSANARFELWGGTAWAALSALYQIKAATAGNADTIGGTGVSALLNTNLIPAGTKMVFYQAAAPSGWTQDVTQNDKALRVVSGAGGEAGGLHALSSPPSLAHTHTGPSHTHAGPNHSHSLQSHTHAGPSHNHTVPNHSHSGTANASGTLQGVSGGAGASDVPNHTHSLTVNAGSPGSTGFSGTGNTGAPSVANTGNAGTGATGAAGTGATGSSTPTAFAPQFIDVIICTRN